MILTGTCPYDFLLQAQIEGICESAGADGGDAGDDDDLIKAQAKVPCMAKKHIDVNKNIITYIGGDGDVVAYYNDYAINVSLPGEISSPC